MARPGGGRRSGAAFSGRRTRITAGDLRQLGSGKMDHICRPFSRHVSPLSLGLLDAGLGENGSSAHVEKGDESAIVIETVASGPMSSAPDDSSVQCLEENLERHAGRGRGAGRGIYFCATTPALVAHRDQAPTAVGVTGGVHVVIWTTHQPCPAARKSGWHARLVSV